MGSSAPRQATASMVHVVCRVMNWFPHTCNADVVTGEQESEARKLVILHS